ncbi:AP2 [Babesia gibsoni]|uniref:AP2 n=1 Tax=Babesia gibsoni TaxID=33632 RepID=A0AAD8PG52_BABGI|nr:AP2 [Babesia gibsoni]
MFRSFVSSMFGRGCSILGVQRIPTCIPPLSRSFLSPLISDSPPQSAAYKAPCISLPWMLMPLRGFAGRQRGLKRRKTKKEPRQIQQAVGRRLELFYPKKARRTRIRLVQNSRGNVIYDPVLHRFMVVYYKQGVQVFRQFRAKGSKFEIARSRALSFARQMAAEHLRRYASRPGMGPDLDPQPIGTNIINMDSKLQPDCNLSGVRGVFFDAKTGAWVAAYKDAGVRKYRLFPTKQLGFQTSYTQAIDFLRFCLYRNHQFLHRKTRTRKNRPTLKP